MRTIIIKMILAYQKVISPLKRKTCRFYPSCSEYTKLAIEKYGAIKGLVIGAKRVVRCHPFNPGGYDPLK